MQIMLHDQVWAGPITSHLFPDTLCSDSRSTSEPRTGQGQELPLQLVSCVSFPHWRLEMGTRILIPCILLLCHEATRCLASYWVQHHSNKTSQNVVSVVIAKLNKSVKSVTYLLRIA